VIAALSTSVTFWLGIYATIVSTLVALLTLYGEIFQRIDVGADEGYRVDLGGPSGRRTVWATEQGADKLGAPNVIRRPGLRVRVRNRGRRPVQIMQILQARWFALDRFMFDEFTTPEILPRVIEPGRTEYFLLGVKQEYRLYNVRRVSRFYAVDGAGRVHPLRERWLQALENVLYRRLLLWRRGRERQQGS
jgi:hypothetical protein